MLHIVTNTASFIPQFAKGYLDTRAQPPLPTQYHLLQLSIPLASNQALVNFHLVFGLYLRATPLVN
jgi:hypothetical protein